MYLGDSGIHYYSYDDGRLVYGQTKITYGDTVKIGSVSMSYDEFLKQLGLVAEYSSTEQKIQLETEAETNPADRSTVSREDRDLPASMQTERLSQMRTPLSHRHFQSHRSRWEQTGERGDR